MIFNFKTGSNVNLIYYFFIYRWFFTSDTHIKEVTLQQVLQSVAYMLFYEKCET